MNQFSKYLCGGLLTLGLWSCASDEPIATEIPKFEGDSAMMTINIYAASDGTRAGADGGTADYTPGTDEENLVRKLNFYFYDQLGEYVTCYEGASYQTLPNSNPGALVEEIGQSKIILTDLLGQNYPSYVVAVLNYGITNTGTADNRFKKSLHEVAKEARENSPWSKRDNKITDFVMTSATHSNNSEDFYYFATPVREENFALQPEDAKPGDDWTSSLAATPVEIYVERLASKVSVTFPGYTLANGYYEMTIRNEDNTADRLFEIDGEKKTLKVRLYGWGINGQAKAVKYFKGVNDKPNAFKTTDGWDYNGNNRSYWAKTPGYGTNNYSSSFSDVSIKTGNPETDDNDDSANNEPLTYISWKTVKENVFSNVSNIAYIMPHTEIGEKINLTGHQINHPAITEVLIAGQIIDENGNPLTLFQLGESYYTKDHALQYLLNAAGNHIYKKTDEGKSKQIELSDVDVKYGYDGTFSVILTTDTEWFQDEACTDSNKWSGTTAVENEINSFLPANQSYCFNDGMLYYNIPIRHLRPFTEGEQITTGVYGVVRNHWYQVTIGAVKNLGHSVYRPNEHIIPPSDPTRYMIGSSVKILSWRIVKQTAEL